MGRRRFSGEGGLASQTDGVGDSHLLTLVLTLV